MKQKKVRKVEMTFNEYCKQRDIQDKTDIPFTEVNKLKSTYPEYELRRGKFIKKKFDSLTYPERIKYVEEHYSQCEFFNTLLIVNDKPGIDIETQGELLDEKCITLFPKDEAEAEVYISWRVQRKLENLRRNFIKVTSQKKYRSEKENFIQNELKKILNEHERETKSKGKYYDKEFHHFIEGYNHRLYELKPYNWRESYLTPIANWWFELPFVKGIVNYDYEHFLKEELIKFKKDNSDNSFNKIWLHWTGNKNQLYDVIKQLKQQGQINNSYTDLAVFLKFNFDNFNKTALSTIVTELQRDKRPTKGKRIILPNRNQD